MPRRSWKLAVVVSAVLVAAIPLPAPLVERVFSQGLYLRFQPFVTAASNHVPFLLLDAMLVGVLCALVVIVWRAFRRHVRSSSRVVWAALNLLVLASAMYLVFQACWGLNYQRLPLAARLDFDRERVTRAAATAWAGQATTRLNQEYPDAYRTPWSEPQDLPARLGTAFAVTQRLLGAARVATPGVPKPTVLAPYFRWAGIDGVTNPFGLDVTINPRVTAAERSFVAAHEWAHLAGFAHEAEANFVAWLTCMHGDAQARYSGWLSVVGHLVNAVPRDERRQLLAALDEGPRRDLTAIAARQEQTLPAVRVVAWQAYDRFLRANRVEEGIVSYDLITELLLGTRFEEGWRPRLR